jgi:hypothetical protein
MAEASFHEIAGDGRTDRAGDHEADPQRSTVSAGAAGEQVRHQQ